MILNEQLKRALKSNWDKRMDGCNVYAWARYFDSRTKFECYLIALSPDETELRVADGYGDDLYEHTIAMNDFCHIHTWEGEFLTRDYEYRPRQIETLINLKKGRKYETI